MVLITMAAMKVDADSCKEMPRMFKKKSKKHVYEVKRGYAFPWSWEARVRCPAGSPWPHDSGMRGEGDVAGDGGSVG